MYCAIAVGCCTILWTFSQLKVSTVTKHRHLKKRSILQVSLVSLQAARKLFLHREKFIRGKIGILATLPDEGLEVGSHCGTDVVVKLLIGGPLS